MYHSTHLQIIGLIIKYTFLKICNFEAMCVQASSVFFFLGDLA